MKATTTTEPRYYMIVNADSAALTSRFDPATGKSESWFVANYAFASVFNGLADALPIARGVDGATAVVGYATLDDFEAGRNGTLTHVTKG